MPAAIMFFKGETHLTPTQRREWSAPSPEQAEAGNYRKPPIAWRGLTVRVENPAGTWRHWAGGKTLMRFDYGYFEDTIGADGEGVDVYLGPDLETAGNVYIVRQRRRGQEEASKWARYDEDKVMAGFKSEAAARAAYLAQYDDDRFLGSIDVMPVDKFVDKALATAKKPGMVKSILFMNVAVRQHLQGGHQVAGYERRQAVNNSDPQAGLRAAHERHRQALRDHFRQYGDGFELRHYDGKQWAILMPDASHSGKYRFQVFDRGGLHAHYTYSSPEDALDGAYDAGFREHDQGAMDRLAPIWEQKFADPERQANTAQHGERADSDRT